MVGRILVCSVIVAAGAFWYAERPAPTQRLPAPASDAPNRVRGAIHVHTTRSDGSGEPADIAAAAARAGLNFVIFTDHGDGTREPSPPRYIDGVLCIDAVEVSTEHGHVLALGLPKSAYPLGGEARDVLDDVERMGGFSIAAHTHSPKAELQWTDRDHAVGGIEWLNADSEWRNESFGSLVRALFFYPVYGSAALTTLLDRPESELQHWDQLAARRRIVGIAGSDAHARLGIRSLGEPDGPGSALHIPSYENTFRMFSNVLTAASLSGNPHEDARSVLEAVREGRTYSVIDAVAGPGVLEFTATSGSTQASMGERLTVTEPATIRVRVSGPDGVETVLIANGEVVQSIAGTTLDYSVPLPAADAGYRVEVRVPGSPGTPPVPWIVSNPIYLARTAEAVVTDPPPAKPAAVAVLYGDGPATGWTVEHSPASLGAMDEVPALGGQQLSLRYALGGTASASPFTAFVMPAGPDLAQYDRLIFSGRSDRPARISVQVRQPGDGDGQRWHRSVYLEPDAREVTVFFADMLPRGPVSTPRPDLSKVDSILFVVDTVNTPLGSNGTLWLDDIRYAR